MKKPALVLVSFAFLSVGCVETDTADSVETTPQSIEETTNTDTTQTLIQEKLDEKEALKKADDSASVKVPAQNNFKIARE